MSRKPRPNHVTPVPRVPATTLDLDELAPVIAGADAWTPGEKLYGVKLGQRHGFVGSSGRLIVAPTPMDAEVLELFGFSEDLMILEVHGKRGIFDIATCEVIPPVFTSADLGGFTEGAWAVQHGRDWGHIDRQGQWLVAPQFAEAKPFSAGLAAVRSGDLWGFVDLRGELVIPPRFTSVGRFAEGLCPCKEADQWGFIDRGGAWVIAPTYRFACEFAEGLAMVMRGQLAGFIDASGHEVIPPRHKWATSFHDGLAKTEDPRIFKKRAKKPPDVFYETRYGYIDTNGDPVLELPAGDYPYIFTRGLAAIGRPIRGEPERRWGFVDRHGATVIPFKYDEACVFDDLGFAQVHTPEGWHVIDTAGEYLARIVVDDDGTTRLLGRDGQLWP